MLIESVRVIECVSVVEKTNVIESVNVDEKLNIEVKMFMISIRFRQSKLAARVRRFKTILLERQSPPLAKLTPSLPVKVERDG